MLCLAGGCCPGHVAVGGNLCSTVDAFSVTSKDSKSLKNRCTVDASPCDSNGFISLLWWHGAARDSFRGIYLGPFHSLCFGFEVPMIPLHAECPSDLELILVEIMGIDGFFPGRWSHSGTPKRTSRRSFASIVAARLEVQRSHDSWLWLKQVKMYSAILYISIL